MFLQVSVCPQGEVSGRHPPEVDTHPGSRHTPSGTDTPPPAQRTVRILLECILVAMFLSQLIVLFKNI